MQLFLTIYLFHFSSSEKETKLDYSRQQQYKRFNKWFDDIVAWTWRGKAVRNSDSLLISLFSIFLKHLPTIMNSHQGIDYDSYLRLDSYLRFILKLWFILKVQACKYYIKCCHTLWCPRKHSQMLQFRIYAASTM